ncbi:MAG TPA: C1 family peptidase [Cytophagaceae bacterium]|nr:C1 family peptidase [Cytophagaceae bacterium]
MKRKYTWKPDLPDHRDYAYVAKKTISLPPLVDLRITYTTVYDQGQLGSCTGNSISMTIDMQRVKQGLAPMKPSRLFIYYNERAMEGSIGEDSGAQIRDGIKSVSKIGYCPEAEWPYKITKFKTKPAKKCYTDAAQNLVKQYSRINNTVLDDLKSVLASGFTFVFGMTVYESFESAKVAKSGMVPMPSKKEKSLGGHAVCCVGYDDSKQCFIVRNSWGKSWGDGGHFYLPYAYITNTNLADDFWTIRLI